MCLLTIVEENDATGVVKATYDEIKGMFGTVPSGLKMWSLLPDGLQHHWEGIKTSFVKDDHANLSHVQRSSNKRLCSTND